MALKPKLTKEEFEALEPAIQALYKAKGDGYVVDVEGFEDLNQKLSEFRTNNIELKKQLEALQKQYKGVDPEKYAEVTKKLQELEDKKMIDEGKLEELLNQRTDRMSKEFQSKLKALEEANKVLESDRAKLTEQLSQHVIDSEIQKAVTSVGSVRQGAMVDILARGRKSFMLHEGKPHPQNDDGSTRYGKDGKAAETVGEWAESLFENAPFLFEGTGGGGAGGGDDTKGKGAELGKLPPAERLKAIHQKGISTKDK